MRRTASHRKGNLVKNNILLGDMEIRVCEIRFTDEFTT